MAAGSAPAAAPGAFVITGGAGDVLTVMPAERGAS